MIRRSFFPSTWTLADLLHYLGDISPQRIRLRPTPGRATEQHVLDIYDGEDRLYELIEGVLVEKVMGYEESTLACELIYFLKQYLHDNDLGNVAGADGALRLMPGLVRIPDISYISWDNLPEGRVPDEPLPQLAPDLAVEILGEGNTAEEMKRKLHDYFIAGTRLVWYIDPRKRTVRVYKNAEQCVELNERQALEGGEVLPGFALPLAQLFARLPGKGRRKKK